MNSYDLDGKSVPPPVSLMIVKQWAVGLRVASKHMSQCGSPEVAKTRPEVMSVDEEESQFVSRPTGARARGDHPGAARGNQKTAAHRECVGQIARWKLRTLLGLQENHQCGTTGRVALCRMVSGMPGSARRISVMRDSMTVNEAMNLPRNANALTEIFVI